SCRSKDPPDEGAARGVIFRHSAKAPVGLEPTRRDCGTGNRTCCVCHGLQQAVGKVFCGAAPTLDRLTQVAGPGVAPDVQAYETQMSNWLTRNTFSVPIDAAATGKVRDSGRTQPRKAPRERA